MSLTHAIDEELRAMGMHTNGTTNALSRFVDRHTYAAELTRLHDQYTAAADALASSLAEVERWVRELHIDEGLVSAWYDKIESLQLCEDPTPHLSPHDHERFHGKYRDCIAAQTRLSNAAHTLTHYLESYTPVDMKKARARATELVRARIEILRQHRMWQMEQL